MKYVMESQSISCKNPREAAFWSVKDFMKKGTFAHKSLSHCLSKQKLSHLDRQLAFQIAYGSIQRKLSLDLIAKKLTNKKKVKLKVKEKALLHTALYQLIFLDKIPFYAVLSESLKLARKYTHKTFQNFLSALLHRYQQSPPLLPQGNDPSDWSLRFSYPEFLIKKLLEDHGKIHCKNILSLGNEKQTPMLRLRRPTLKGSEERETIGCARDFTPLTKKVETNNSKQKDRAFSSTDKESFLKTPLSTSLSIYTIESKDLENKNLTESPHFYIQNATPIFLMAQLAKITPYPATILDLCASPGGKTLMAYDLFPKSRIWANDVTDKKMLRLEENIKKYHIPVNLSCTKGESYKEDQSFDLLILDVPCSNTGVLNKRPEARWRSPKSLKDCLLTQNALLEKALRLTHKNSYIWYLTCSILKEENEYCIQNFCQKHPLELIFSQCILPNVAGWDGGFAACLKRS